MDRQPQVVYGTTWRRHSGRRQRAARIARMLRPVAHVLGGLVSTELTAPVGDRWFRPDVGVLLTGDPPLDGVLHRAPPLVVHLGGLLPAEAWLHAGADAVWAIEGGAVRQLTPAGRRTLASDQWLTYPDEPALRLPAGELTGAPVARTRMAV